MEKLNVKIVILGNLRHEIDLKKIKGFKSKYFRILNIERISKLPESRKDDGYLDVEYSQNEIIDIMSGTNSSDIVFGIINYRFDDNFYLHRTGPNKACLSIANVAGLLVGSNISLENFILKNIFEVAVIRNTLGTLTDDDNIYRLVHKETRGCLFDLNGDLTDVIYNTEKPKFCDSCKAFISSKPLPEKYIEDIEKELNKIRKPTIFRIELFIKKYPLFSILLVFVFSIIINLLSNLIWDIFR